MRIRFTIEIRAHRQRRQTPEPEPQFEHRDNDGTMVIHHDQPRYIGFKPVEPEEPSERH